MSKREFPDDFPEWVGDVQAAAKMLISHPTTKVDYRISVEKLMTLGVGIKTITITTLAELDDLAEGAYIIKGAAQGLLVVVDDPAPDIRIEPSIISYACATNNDEYTGVKRVIQGSFGVFLNDSFVGLIYMNFCDVDNPTGGGNWNWNAYNNTGLPAMRLLTNSQYEARVQLVRNAVNNYLNEQWPSFDTALFDWSFTQQTDNGYCVVGNQIFNANTISKATTTLNNDTVVVTFQYPVASDLIVKCPILFYHTSSGEWRSHLIEVVVVAGQLTGSSVFSYTIHSVENSVAATTPVNNSLGSINPPADSQYIYEIR